MPHPSLKTPARIETMIAMHRRGASAREIADALERKVSHVAITKWLKDAGLKPNGGAGERGGRKRREPNGMSGPIMDAQAQLAELASAPAPKNYAEVLERLRKNFGLAAAFVEFQFAQAKLGRSTMAEVEKATKIQDAFAVKIRELTPAAPPDPNESPDASASADAVIAKLMRIVETARANARCAHCGRNPNGGSR